MRVGIYNLEPRIINLALEKIRVYYQQRGDIILPCSPIEKNSGFDIVYASSIFDWSKKDYITPDLIVGGTGFNLTTELPSEIEMTEPHINMGYTTRGCIHRCPFCVVWQKEGYIRATGDIISLWDGRSKTIILLDNNPLALIEHFNHNCEQLRYHNLKVDWNQGLDHRLLTPEIIDIIHSVRHHELRFAFDHPSYINSVEKAIEPYS